MVDHYKSKGKALAQGQGTCIAPTDGQTALNLRPPLVAWTEWMDVKTSKEPIATNLCNGPGSNMFARVFEQFADEYKAQVVDKNDTLSPNYFEIYRYLADVLGGQFGDKEVSTSTALHVQSLLSKTGKLLLINGFERELKLQASRCNQAAFCSESSMSPLLPSKRTSRPSQEEDAPVVITTEMQRLMTKDKRQLGRPVGTNSSHEVGVGEDEMAKAHDARCTVNWRGRKAPSFTSKPASRSQSVLVSSRTLIRNSTRACPSRGRLNLDSNGTSGGITSAWASGSGSTANGQQVACKRLMELLNPVNMPLELLQMEYKCLSECLAKEMNQI